MKNKTKVILYAVLIMAIFTSGWTGNEIYREYSNKRMYDGLRFELNSSHSKALDMAGSYDKSGDWICVNINGMSYKRAIEVCNHEVGHEIFAEECEKNITKCMDVVGI